MHRPPPFPVLPNSYMISSNIGEVASIFLTGALGMPEGMVPVQLLWVNLVTDGPPATALGFNPPDIGVMSKPPRRADEALINNWVLFRYMVIGLYVGAATVGAFAIWFTHTSFLGLDLGADGHSTVTFRQLTHWTECEHWSGFTASPWRAFDQVRVFDKPCDVFSPHGKAKASTLSLSVLVVIEMMNALNALSEDGSLLSMPPWVNPYLLVAIAFSIGVHCVILYVPAFARIFQIVPLNLAEWGLVALLSVPVILIDEVLKFFGAPRWGLGMRQLFLPHLITPSFLLSRSPLRCAGPARAQAEGAVSDCTAACVGSGGACRAPAALLVARGADRLVRMRRAISAG